MQARSSRIGARSLPAALLLVACVLAGPTVGSADAHPVNNLAPEVVGFPTVGETLVCGAGSWSGSVSKFTYEWVRDAVPVGSSVTYQVTPADEGHSLWCYVTASGGEGEAEAQSGNSVEIPGHNPGSPPENTAAPTVSGTPSVGETLTCSEGKWSGSPSPTFAYQWVRVDGAERTSIESATASTYQVLSSDAGHTLACVVTASNSAGSASALSGNSLHIPASKPEDLVAPQVLGLEPAAVGETVTCSPGTWSERPAPTFAYRWVRDRGLSDQLTITGATGSTYAVEAADQLKSLSCKVIATNSAGSTEAASNNSVNVGGSKPENTVAPTVSGSPTVGATLTCEKGSWTGAPAPTYEYVWIRDQGTAGEVAIGSASTSAYTATPPDRGHTLSCEVTATNSEGHASQISERVVVPADANGIAPQNDSAPAVSGQAALGAELSCSEGAWSGNPAPTITYQWLRDGSPIGSATRSTYVVLEADQGHSLSCRVTAANDEGLASATSSALEIPGWGPENSEAPQVSGTPAVGEALTCLKGKWSGAPAPTYSFQWLRNGTSIPSATASSYTLTSEDRGRSISCRVTAQSSAGTLALTSSNQLEIPGLGPQNTSAPEVTGTASVGQVLSCSPGTWSGQPAPTFTYQWLLDGTGIPAATASRFTVANADRGLVLSCEVTASNGEGSQSASSKGIHIPGAMPEDVEAPQITGSPAAGQPLTCQRGIWTGQPPPAFAYQWLRDGTRIASATSGTYTVELADVGHLLSCEVTATNSEGKAEVETKGVAVLRPKAGTETKPDLSFPPATISPAEPTVAEILATLHVQLARAQHHVRIALLRRTGLYAFAFAAPTAGKLEISWYQATSAAQHSTAVKPLVLAQCSTSFARAGAKTVTLRLTSAGRSTFSRSMHVLLTFKGAFLRPHARPVNWLETVVMGH